MRGKIIFFYGGIVVVLAALTFFLLRTAVGNVVANPSVQRKALERSLRSANAQLAVDALMAERWLARRVLEPGLQEVFAKGTASARQESATSEANRLRDLAVGEPGFARMNPSLVLLVDKAGVGLGRNGSELMRGDEVGEAYPEFLRVLLARGTGSDVWVRPERQEQLLVSYAPVVGEGGNLLGGVVLGMALSDERLTRTSELTSGCSLELHVGGVRVASGGPSAPGLGAPAVREAASRARPGSVVHAAAPVAGLLAAAVPLAGFSRDGVVLVGAVPASLVPSVDGLLWPVFAVAVLGLLLVVAGGVVLGNYISRPISEIEEGLLLVMNGQRDLRFELEHDELGGLTSQINALLNAPTEPPDEPQNPS
jgi:hypothetical protein